MTNVQWATEALGRDIAPEPTASEWLNGGRWTVEELDEAEAAASAVTVATLEMAAFCA